MRQLSQVTANGQPLPAGTWRVAAGGSEFDQFPRKGGSSTEAERYVLSGTGEAGESTLDLTAFTSAAPFQLWPGCELIIRNLTIKVAAAQDDQADGVTAGLLTRLFGSAEPVSQGPAPRVRLQWSSLELSDCSDLAALPHALCDPETWSPAAAAPGVTISRGTVRYSNTALKLPHSDPAQGPEVALESVSVGCPDSGPRSQRSCSMGWVDGAGALAAVGSALLAAAGAHAAHSAEGNVGSTGGGEVVLLAVAANVSLAAGSWAPLAVPRGVTLRLQGVPTQSGRAVEIDFGGLPGALSLAPSPSSRLALSDLLLRGLAYPPAISRQEHLLGAFLHAAGQPWSKYTPRRADAGPRVSCIRCALVLPDAEVAWWGNAAQARADPWAMPRAWRLLQESDLSQSPADLRPTVRLAELSDAQPGPDVVQRVVLTHSALLPYSRYGGAVLHGTALAGSSWPLAQLFGSTSAAGDTTEPQPSSTPRLALLKMLSLSDAGSNLASCSPALNITTLLVPSAQGALASSAAELPAAALRAEGAGTAAGARAVLLTASGTDAPAGEGEGEGGGGVYPGGFSSLAEGVECTLTAPPLAQAGRRVAWDTRGMARQVGIPATSNLTVSGVILYNLAPTGSRYPGQATAFLPEEGDKVGGDTGAASPPPLAAQSPTAKAFANHSLSLWLFDFDRDLSASPLSPVPFPLRLRNVTLVVHQAELDLLRHMLKQASRLPPDASAPAPGGAGRRTLLGGALEGPQPRGRRVVLSGLDDTPAAAQAAAAARRLAAAESSKDAASRVDRWRGCVYTHLVWFAAESRVTSASSDTLVFSSLRHYGWRGSGVTVTSALPPDTPTLLLQAPGQGGDGEVIVIDVMAGCPVVTDPVVPSPPLPSGDSPANGSIGATGPALEPIPEGTPNNEEDHLSSAPSPGLVAGAVVGSVAAAVAAAAVAVRVAKRRRRSRSGSQVLHDGSYAALDSAGNSNDSSRGGRGGADGSASDLWAAVGLPRRAPAPGAEPQDPAPTVAILLEADAAEGGAPERAVERARRPGGGRFSARALSRLCAASGAPSHPAPTAAPRTVAPSGPIPATQTTASPAEPGPAATAAVAAAGPVRSPAGAGQDPALDDSSDGGGGSLCFAGRSRRRLTTRNDTGGSRFSTPTGAGVLPLPPPLFAAEEAAGRTGPLAQAQVSIHLADEPPAAAAGAGGGGDGGGTTGSKRRRWGRVISGSQLEAAAATAAAGAAGSLLAGAGAAGGIAAAAASWGGPREGPMAEAEIRIQLADEVAAAGAGSSRSRRRWGVRISSAGA